MPSRKLFYVASASATITLASLPTSSTLVSGREAAAIDNSSNLYLDYKFGGKVTTGTSPVAGVIEVWCIPETNDSSWPVGFDGTDSAGSPTTRDTLQSCGRLMAFMVTDTTSNQAYPFQFNILDRFKKCPRKFTIFITHNTNVNLNSTGGNHIVDYQGIYETVG